MHPTKLAVWPWPYSRYVYIRSSHHSRYQRLSPRAFSVAKITAIGLIVAALGLRIISGPLTGLNQASAQELSFNNLPVVTIPLIKPTVDDQLQAMINSWVASQPNSSQWGVVVQQLQGGSTYASYQPTQSFYPASLYKLLILQSLFEKLPYSAWGKSIGQGNTYSSCIDKMIRLSDNNCGVAVGGFTGWTTANNRLKSLGLASTVINGSDQQLKTTAADVGAFLKYFYNSNAYPQAKQAVMDSMSKQIYNKGIQAGSPGCTVYDKVGELNGYLHDAAIVECNSVTYSLVIMSKGGSYTQIADLSNQINNYLNR